MIALVPILTLTSWCVASAIGFVRPGAEVGSLKRSVESAVPGGVKTRVCVNIGAGTCALTRLGIVLAPLPPEAKSAIGAARGADVSVCELEKTCGQKELRTVLAAADARMNGRGWDRVVGVMEPGQLVAVYCPRKGMTLGKTRVCVLVVDKKDVVLVCARANLESLQPLVCNALEKSRKNWPDMAYPPAIL